MASRSFGVSSSAWAMTCSMLPYLLTSWAAVLSPTPGTPGKLSEFSPLSATKSVHCSGVTLNHRRIVVTDNIRDSPPRHDYRDAVPHQLEDVPVPGHDDDFTAFLL